MFADIIFLVFVILIFLYIGDKLENIILVEKYHTY